MKINCCNKITVVVGDGEIGILVILSQAMYE